MISRPSDCLHHKSDEGRWEPERSRLPRCVARRAEWPSDVVTVGALPLQYGPSIRDSDLAATHAVRISASEVMSVSSKILNGAGPNPQRSDLDIPSGAAPSPVRDPFERPRQLNRNEQ